MQRRIEGRIVTIGSLSQFGVAGNASYAVSKGGLSGLTRMIARQYRHVGIDAMAVIPGYIETELSASMSESARRKLIEGCPAGRPGSPDEVAAVVAFLLSAEGHSLDGEAILASGGLTEVPV